MSITPNLQNALITPVPAPTPNHFPVFPGHKPSTQADRWLLVLTGVCIIDVQGEPGSWSHKTIHIDIDLSSLLKSTIESLGGIIELASSYSFQVAQEASFATISSVFDQERGGVDVGFAVDGWQLSLVDDFFNGLDVDVAVLNNQATLSRISYHLTLLGKIHATQLFKREA